MARPWRIEYERALYYVFSRGNNQQGAFVTDKGLIGFRDRTCAKLTSISRPSGRWG